MTSKMKIQCEVCEKAEAELLCCADEAVVCKDCDGRIHSANKLFQKHERVALLKPPAAAATASSSSSSTGAPLCDVCQERNGYFFCVEDRALLCKHCDGSIHATSSHQRFLITGVQLNLQSFSDDNTSHNGHHLLDVAAHEAPPPAVSVSDTPDSFDGAEEGKARVCADTDLPCCQLSDMLGINADVLSPMSFPGSDI